MEPKKEDIDEGFELILSLRQRAEIPIKKLTSNTFPTTEKITQKQIFIPHYNPYLEAISYQKHLPKETKKKNHWWNFFLRFLKGND